MGEKRVVVFDMCVNDERETGRDRESENVFVRVLTAVLTKKRKVIMRNLSIRR